MLQSFVIRSIIGKKYSHSAIKNTDFILGCLVLSLCVFNRKG